MTLAELIGSRIRAARTKKRLTQAELGAHLERFLGKAWAKQQIYEAERGRRVFTAEELVALSYVLGVPLWALFGPPEGSGHVVVFPGGVRLNSRQMQTVLFGKAGEAPDRFNLTAVTFWEIADRLAEVTADLMSIESFARRNGEVIAKEARRAERAARRRTG